MLEYQNNNQTKQEEYKFKNDIITQISKLEDISIEKYKYRDFIESTKYDTYIKNIQIKSYESEYKKLLVAFIDTIKPTVHEYIKTKIPSISDIILRNISIEIKLPAPAKFNILVVKVSDAVTS